MKREDAGNALIFREIQGDMERLVVGNLLESSFAPMKDREAAERFIKVLPDVAKLWVLDIEGSISGTLSANPVPNKDGVWMLNNFSVAPYWRKGGLGRFMLENCFEYLRQQGCRIVVVLLHPELAAAEQLFLKELEFTAIREEGSKGVYLASLKF